MKFRTEITIKDASETLSPERLVVLMGSCFSDNIGARMEECGWPVVANPCGVVYNPVSLAILFQLALSHRTLRRQVLADSITEREGRFVSWFMSAVVNGSTREECVEKAMECLDRLEEGIEKAQAIFITFGTSDVWLLKDPDRAVGNCHKHPASEFSKSRVSINEITSTWKAIMGAVKERNDDVKFVFTVSPRRYLSDGFEENSRQKAVLILACEELTSQGAHHNDEGDNAKRATYFPAFEIMNDDLRDYRFYDRDLLHPSPVAIDYIWEKFQSQFLTPESRELLRRMERETKKTRHHPILPLT